MRQFSVSLMVTCDDDNPLASDIAGVISRLIDIGYDDAADSADCMDLDKSARAEAEAVTELTIGEVAAIEVGMVNP